MLPARNVESHETEYNMGRIIKVKLLVDKVVIVVIVDKGIYFCLHARVR